MSWLTDVEMAEREPPPWLVRDVLHQGAFAVLVGARSVGKTFVALDMAFAVAGGTYWHGHETRMGPVVYISAEGAGGMGLRIRAWRQHRDIPKGISTGIWFWDKDVQIATVANRQAFQAELEKVEREANTPPQLIIVDTLARCFVGYDENAVQDMGKFVAGIDILRSTGAAVMILHHEGHKKGRERGSTALGGAADAILHLASGESDEVVVLRCMKQRESEPFETVYLQLQPVALGPEVSSCVVVDAPDVLALHPTWIDALKELPADAAHALAPTDWFRRIVAKQRMVERSFWRMKKALLRRGMVLEVDGKLYRDH